MLRRHALLSLAAVPLLRGSNISLRGKLGASGDKPVLKTADGKLIVLEGDDDTIGVLQDKRLADVEFEVVGTFTGNGRFKVNPIHTRAMFVHKDGKRLIVTYWCDVCSIRTYTPGICWCCREETALDLREADKVDNK